MQKHLFFLPIFCSFILFQSCGGDEPTEPEQTINTVPEFFKSSAESLYGSKGPEVEVVANRSAGLDFPRDLAFHSFDDRKNELWVLNPGTDNTGAYTTIFFDPNTDAGNYDNLQDGNAWHFMALASSLAFGDNGNWATAQGILCANRQNIMFTGPTLWSSDMSIYAQVGINPTPQVNGSHLDMIHQTPYGMGIAHEVENIYWVFDGYNRTICRYDFVQPHYPGGPDHSDGKVWRYREPQVRMDNLAEIPSHMILDKNTGWLYICDTGNKRVIKLNTNSGTEITGTPRVPNRVNEELALYTEVEGAEWEVVADSGLFSPSGIAMVDNRLFVTDFGNGNIMCYDKESHELLGQVETNGKGVAGLEIGPNGSLWFVNAIRDELCKLQPQSPDEI